MYCPRCNSSVPEGNHFCGNCGANLSAGNSYQPYNTNPPNYPVEDPTESLLPYKLLSFVIPIAGIVLYFVDKDSRPLRAKACIKYSLISIVLSFVISILITIGGIAFSFFAASNGYDDDFLEEYIEVYPQDVPGFEDDSVYFEEDLDGNNEIL